MVAAANETGTRELALIVEDDPSAADVASGMLGMLGYRTRIAADGHAALYALSETPPDLILLDICLPEMDGVTLMKVARRVEETRTTPVVACSAVYPPEGSVARILEEMGVLNYLSKPFNLAALRSAVRDAHPTGPAGAASITRRTSPAARTPQATGGAPQDPASNAPPATLILRLEDVVATVHVDGRDVPMLVERAGEDWLALRAGEAALKTGESTRLSITLRRAVADAMTETNLRILGEVVEAIPTPRGTRFRLTVQTACPSEGLSMLRAELARP